MDYKLCLVVVLFTLIRYQGISQKNYVKGEVLTNEAASISGQIDYQNWLNNPQVINFIDKQSSKSISYSPKDIRSFSVLNEKYISRVVSIDKKSQHIDYLTSSEYPENTSDTVFLRVLFQGSKDLYYLRKKNGREYFFISDGEKVKLLDHHIFMIHNQGIDIKREKLTYRGQLSFYFKDEPELSSIISEARYDFIDITEIFTLYYKNQPGKFLIYQEDKQESSTKVRFFTGLSKTSFQLTGVLYEGLRIIENESSFYPVIGFAISYGSKRNFSRLRAMNEFLFTTHKSAAINDEGWLESKLGGSYIKTNFLMQYYLRKEGIRPFVNAGISGGYLISNTNYVKDANPKHVKVVEGPLFPELRKYELSYLIGGGIESDRYALEFRLEKGDGISPYVYINAKSLRLYLLFSYRV